MVKWIKIKKKIICFFNNLDTELETYCDLTFIVSSRKFI
jgi:hypothetical protein